MDEGTEAQSTGLVRNRAKSRARPVSLESNEQLAHHFFLSTLPHFVLLNTKKKNLNLIGDQDNLMA